MGGPLAAAKTPVSNFAFPTMLPILAWTNLLAVLSKNAFKTPSLLKTHLGCNPPYRNAHLASTSKNSTQSQC